MMLAQMSGHGPCNHGWKCGASDDLRCFSPALLSLSLPAMHSGSLKKSSLLRPSVRWPSLPRCMGLAAAAALLLAAGACDAAKRELCEGQARAAAHSNGNTSMPSEIRSQYAPLQRHAAHTTYALDAEQLHSSSPQSACRTRSARQPPASRLRRHPPSHQNTTSGPAT